MELLSILVVVAALVYVVERIRSTVLRLPALQVQAVSQAQEKVPGDLVGLALMESEPWAQEELLAAMRESHEKLGDWNSVRARFGVGALGELKE